MTSSAARAVALVALATGSVAALFCCVVDTAWTPHVFAASIVILPVALMLLGAAQSARPVKPSVIWTLGLLVVILSTSMAGLLWTRGSDATWFGLPAGVVLLVAGLFLLPLALSTLGFAASFDDPTDEDADRP